MSLPEMVAKQLPGNDASLLPITSQSIGIHHPDFGVMLKKQMVRLKIEYHVYADGVSLDRESVMSEIKFLKQQFKMD